MSFGVLLTDGQTDGWVDARGSWRERQRRQVCHVTLSDSLWPRVACLRTSHVHYAGPRGALPHLCEVKPCHKMKRVCVCVRAAFPGLPSFYFESATRRLHWTKIKFKIIMSPCKFWRQILFKFRVKISNVCALLLAVIKTTANCSSVFTKWRNKTSTPEENKLNVALLWGILINLQRVPCL